MQPSNAWSGTHRILIADDEPDIHAVTKLSLKSLIRKTGPIEFLSAESGAQTLELLRLNPDISVVLLDVVMETDHAGLDVCRAVRTELDNKLVRILLRTGQPGAAPERQTIDSYDIDGYLSKAETSSNRLYTSVRCALKSYQELVALSQHRAYLSAVHDCAIALSAMQPVEEMLRPVLETALTICAAPMCALQLETFEHGLGPHHTFLYLAPEPNRALAQAAAEELRVRVQAAGGGRIHAPCALAGGFLVPLRLHQELGHGWIFIDAFKPDELLEKILTVLAGHAQNAVYASLALTAARERKNVLFEEVVI